MLKRLSMRPERHACHRSECANGIVLASKRPLSTKSRIAPRPGTANAPEQRANLVKNVQTYHELIGKAGTSRLRQNQAGEVLIKHAAAGPGLSARTKGYALTALALRGVSVYENRVNYSLRV
ncbi:unnamed protein product, partial [Iphiclides podalirius]